MNTPPRCCGHPRSIDIQWHETQWPAALSRGSRVEGRGPDSRRSPLASRLHRWWFCAALAGALFVCSAQGQTLINVDFGVGTKSAKVGPAATGQSTNDFWNLYRHYEPKFTPGLPLVSDGVLKGLKQADGSATGVSISVSNAPGVWGNASGDAMYDSYIFSQNGSNITVAVRDLEPGRYHFYFYGHADADVTGEQNSIFHLRSGTNVFGPLMQTPESKVGHLRYVVARDVPVISGEPVMIEVAAGANGVPVLNGLQIVSRGTSPPHFPVAALPKAASVHTNVLFREARYTGESITDTEARFAVDLLVQSMATNEVSGVLFEGDVAVSAPSLPKGVRIVSSAKKYHVVVSAPGEYRFSVGVVARIQRSDAWNRISFIGPAAAVASLNARPQTAGVEMQLLSGTPLNGSGDEVKGLIGADRVVALRWQSKTSEVNRRSLVTVETSAVAHISPTVIKYQTELRYEILQAPIPRLVLELPASHALTRLQGEQIRDWAVKTDAGRQLLTVELIKAVEKQYALTVFTEQSISATPPVSAELALPQPLDVTREAGSLSVSAEGAVVEMESATGLRQVNAAAGILAAYRFHGRPIALTANVKQVEPVVKATDRVTARLEEARLLVRHAVTLSVEKAGIYSVDMTPQSGFTVTAVQGDGVEDWSVSEGRLKISFASRLIGSRRIEVQLEQALRTFPPEVTIAPLPVAGAVAQKAEIGAAPAPGISVKTSAGMQGVREVPVSGLSGRSDELLAFTGEGSDWRVALMTERLPARIVAEVFNLITIGDGLVGGSATIRYGLINQGVQAFQVKLPAHWKNVDFTGPNIRRKDAVANPADTNHVVWNIALQDKAWGGYTLVVTYDYPFDPQKASLDLRGAHALGAERETGSMAITTAASVQLRPGPAAEPLRVIDQTELAETDRALINRPVLLAYHYAGEDYRLALDVTRHEEVRMLEAVADRTQITSVLTEAGEMLTQASFMVKNNDKQFQRFLLPARAEFWACYVNSQPSKAERDGDWLLISLPRTANRDEAFAVELVYAQKFEAMKARVFPDTVQLTAPRSDVPNTFAEWQVYAPKTLKLTGFSGSMSVLRGTTYGFKDGWGRFVDYYAGLWRERGAGILLVGGAILFFVSLVVGAARSGKHGFVTVVVVFAIAAVMAGMLLPSLAKAKARAQRINAVSSLKQIGLAARMYANDHGGKFPNNYEEMMKELNSDKILRDPKSGERFVYVGAGKNDEMLGAIIAYSPVDLNGRVVAFADGSVAQMTSEQFAEALRNDASGRYAANVPAPSHPALANTLAGGVAGAAAAPALIAAAPAALATPMVTGLRSIRIELPRSGQPYTFTKVLNARQEPLTIRMSGMSHKWYNARRSALQLGAFIAGLLVLWVQLRRAQRSTLALAVGVMLVVVSMASLLIAARALHAAFIVGMPLIAAVLCAQVIRSLWPKHVPQAAETSLANGTSPATPGPAVAAIALGLFFAPMLGAMAQEKTNAVSIVSAAYSGSVKEKVAQFTAKLQVTSVAPDQRVPLFGEEVAIQEFTSKGMQLLRDGKGVSLQLKDAGTHEAQLRFAVKLAGDVSKQQLNFGIPAALSSDLHLTIEEPDADVEFSSAVAFKRVAEGNATRVEGIVGAGDRVEMAWTPRVKRVAEMEASVFAQTHTVVTTGAGVVNTRALIDYQVSQGELRRLRVRLPPGQRLLRVEGEMIRTWELADENILTVELVKGAAPGYRLTVETERSVEKLPAEIKVEVPVVLGVIRQTGAVALRTADEVSLTVESANDVARIDAAELQSALKVDGITAAFRHLKPEFDLRARAELVRPQIEAVVRNSIRVGFEQTRISARVAYSIRKVGVFAVRLGIPEGFKVESVTAASNILQWVEKTNPASVDVTLKQRTVGELVVNVELIRAHTEAPARVETLGVHPLDATKITGFVSAMSEAGLGVKAVAAEGLTEIPAVELGDKTDSTAAVLAYKYVTSQATNTAPWKLALATEMIESWVRAEIVHSYSISETVVSGKALVRYDIQNAPVKEFRLRIPQAFTNIDVFGANIRRRDPGAEYRVELQTKVRGTYTLTVTWEQPRGAGTNIALQTIQALGVERETGAIVVLAKPPLQVTEQSASEQLIKADARELPEWAGVTASASSSSEAAVLVYQYLRPGPSLTVQANRFSDAAVLQALAEDARLVTVVAEDGQAMTEMTLSIRNNGKQHLQIELPVGATPWSAFVAGQPVRPKKIGDKLLLPLDASSGSETPISVEITFMGSFQFPRRKGDVTLASPRLDVPIKNARWEVYLPLDYEYSDFGGSMGHEREIVPVSQMFSLSEYARQEQDKKAARKSELRGYVSSVRRGLSEGKVKVAVEELSQVERLTAADAVAQQELVDLRKEVSRVQSSNLIQAQRAYTLENNDRFGIQAGERAQAPQKDGLMSYDADAAEQQWRALQRAQTVSATRVQPLRVNLPTRGLRHSFTQVLQTEVQKPLTIQFEARNTSSVGWFKRIAYSIGGFALLWIFVSALDVRRRERGIGNAAAAAA